MDKWWSRLDSIAKEYDLCSIERRNLEWGATHYDYLQNESVIWHSIEDIFDSCFRTIDKNEDKILGVTRNTKLALCKMIIPPDDYIITDKLGFKFASEYIKKRKGGEIIC